MTDQLRRESSMRVNARLDDSYAEKLDFLQASTHLTMSDIIREAVDRYYVAVVAERSRKQSSLDALVGAFAGRPETPDDLSLNYKRYLAEALDAELARQQQATADFLARRGPR